MDVVENYKRIVNLKKRQLINFFLFVQSCHLVMRAIVFLLLTRFSAKICDVFKFVLFGVKGNQISTMKAPC